VNVEIVDPKSFGASHDTVTCPLCNKLEVKREGGSGIAKGFTDPVTEDRESPAALVARTANWYVLPPVRTLYLAT